MANENSTTPADKAHEVTPEELEQAAEQMRADVRAEIQAIEQLEAAYPELVAQIREQEQPVEIISVAELTDAYPELVSQIIEERNEQLEEHIKTRTVGQFKEHFPDLHARIIKAAQPAPAQQVNVNGKGFLLETDDPFAAGTLRTFGNLAGIEGLRLPYMLPWKNAATKKTLVNYITRISGSDAARTKVAEAALVKHFKTTYAQEMKKKK